MAAAAVVAAAMAVVAVATTAVAATAGDLPALLTPLALEAQQKAWRLPNVQNLQAFSWIGSA
jgi:hypothetical protein